MEMISSVWATLLILVMEKWNDGMMTEWKK